MPRIELNDSPYAGTVSRPPWGGPRYETECRRCGSTLAGRREQVRRETTRGIRYVTEVFRCRCGAGHRVTRQVGGAAG